jgi:Flp pilus assembly protein TadD
MRQVPRMMRTGSVFGRIAVAVAMIAILTCIVLWRVFHEREVIQGRTTLPSPATYVGAERCALCHAEETALWRNSHHALAMQKMNEATVLGDFRNARFSSNGAASVFSTKDGKYSVRTEGADGTLRNFELAYTFGVSPLQQYLVPFPNGRMQSLAPAWDSRAKQQGGQRWFHLYQNRKMAPDDPLHWTGRNQNWNYMCAECHSTDLRKNYNLAADSYDTTWSEINVSCESCHGPGSNHVTWAGVKRGSKAESGGNGLVVNLRRATGSWALEDSNPNTLHWKGQTRTGTELETCAPCHSRRHPITNNHHPGQPFADSYVPSLLDSGVYYADGQILEEDYEYGSFLQSKMHRLGVTCSDCHNPHDLKLASANLNVVCEGCHLPEKFNTAEHHHHKAESSGALCVNCHMPSKTYMVVDARRDHSFRVPRPDFSIAYGTPNACTQCHKDHSPEWASAAVAKWYGPNRRQEAQFVGAIDAGRRGLTGAERALTALATDVSQPAIARATGLSLLSEYLTPASVPALRTGAADNDPLVRMAAVQAMASLPLDQRLALAVPLLADPTRSVRIEAARLLAGTSPQLTTEGPTKNALARTIAELVESELASAERPENHVNLASLYAQMNRTSDAESELRTALRLDPNFVPAMINLADLYRAEKREEEGQQLLLKAIAASPNAAEPVHALGLLKVRQKEYADALTLLSKAASLQPDNTRYSYVYAVALQSDGKASQAVRVLEDVHKRRPADREILLGLISFERENGNLTSAIKYAQELTSLVPSDPMAKRLLAHLLTQNR